MALSICISSLSGLLLVQDASERAVLIPAGLSDGQFYSPPESEAGKKGEPCHLCLVCLEASLFFPLLPPALSISWSVQQILSMPCYKTK